MTIVERTVRLRVLTDGSGVYCGLDCPHIITRIGRGDKRATCKLFRRDLVAVDDAGWTKYARRDECRIAEVSP